MRLQKLLSCLLLLSLAYFNHLGYCQESGKDKRIISLGPSITQEIYLLGAEDKLAGCTVYCNKPEEAKAKERVATAVDINVEKIVSLQPDLVLATSLTNKEGIEKLKSLGVPVSIIPMAKDFNQLCEQFLELGKIVEKEKTARNIIDSSRQRVDLIKKRVKGLEKRRLFVQVGSRPLFTLNKDSYVNDLIEFAGGINIGQDSEIGLYTRELVLEKNPDVIIITTMGIAGKGEKDAWMKYKTINAVKNNDVHIIDQYMLCSATPVTFAEALEKIEGILHH